MKDPIKWIMEGASFGGIRNYVWLGALVLIAAASATIIAIADNAVGDTLNTAEKAGEAKAVARGHETTLSQTEKANAAGNEVRDDRDNARYDSCLLDNQSAPGNCERYRR